MPYKDHSMRAARALIARIADAIKEHGPMTVFDIADRCGAAHSSVTEVIRIARNAKSSGEFPRFFIADYRVSPTSRRSVARAWGIGNEPDAQRKKIGRKSPFGDWRTSPLGKLFVAHLKHTPASVSELAKANRCLHSSAGRVVRMMLADKAIYISAWSKPSGHGPLCAVYSLGDNPHAERPKRTGARPLTETWKNTPCGKRLIAFLGSGSEETARAIAKKINTSLGRTQQLIAAAMATEDVRIARWDVSSAPYTAFYAASNGKRSVPKPTAKAARAIRKKAPQAELAKIREVVTQILGQEDAANIANAYQSKSPGRIVIGRRTVYENGRVNWDAIEQFKEAA